MSALQDITSIAPPGSVEGLEQGLRSVPVRDRLRLAFLLMAMFIGSAVAMTYLTLDQLEGDAPAINYSGSERMRMTKLAYLANRVYLTRGAEQQQVSKTLGYEIDRYQTVLLGLQQGDSELDLLATRDERIRVQLQRVWSDWQSYRPLLEQVLVEYRTGDSSALHDIDRRVFKNVEAVNRLTELYQDASTAKLDNLKRIVTTLVIFDLITGTLVAWLLSRSIVGPLKKLAERSERLAAGDLQTPGWISEAQDRARDEVGQLAKSFDHMALALQRSIETLEQRVTERTRELQSRNTALKAASHAQSQFLATVSHELRTPLNAILGFTDLTLLEVDGPLTAAQKENLNQVSASANTLLGLINDILDTAKIEAGKVTLQLQPVEVARVMYDCAGSLRTQALSKGLHLTCVVETGLEVVSDEKRLRQVVTNLLSNAVKFTTAGSIRLIIRSLDEKTWQISVSDTGVGIPAEHLEHIFEAFYQVDGSTTRLFSGTGLGLAIVRELVAHLGGTLAVESRVNRGTTFTVTLPKTLRVSQARIEDGQDFAHRG